MTDAERASQLADEIADEMNELRKRFANRENDHFSFGLKFSSWDVILAALRLLAKHPASPAPDGLQEEVEAAMKAKRAELIASPLQRIWPDLTDAALSSISAAGYDLVKRGHWVAYQPDQPGTYMVSAALATKE